MQSWLLAVLQFVAHRKNFHRFVKLCNMEKRTRQWKKETKLIFVALSRQQRNTHFVIYGGCIREKSLIFTLCEWKMKKKRGRRRGIRWKNVFYTSVGICCDLKFVDCSLAAVSENDKLVRFELVDYWLDAKCFSSLESWIMVSVDRKCSREIDLAIALATRH